MPDELPPLLEKLARMRAEAGRDRLPFERFVGLEAPPEVDSSKRLEEKGMTGGVSDPFELAPGARSSFDAKQNSMGDYAERIIRCCRWATAPVTASPGRGRGVPVPGEREHHGHRPLDAGLSR